MDFNFEGLTEKTSSEFIAHIKSELMGPDYGSVIVRHEVIRDTKRLLSVRFLESWTSASSERASLTVLVFHFFYESKSFHTEFREMVSVMEDHLNWVNEVFQ